MIILWIFLIILGLILLLMTWLMVSRITILIDSDNKQYHIRMPVFLKVELILGEGKTAIKFTILGFSKTVRSFGLEKRKPGKTGAEKKKPGKMKFKAMEMMKIMPGYLKRFIRSFKVEKCRIELDTGDYSVNSYLYPVSYFISSGRFELIINYNDQNSFYLLMHNRPVRLLWIGLGLYWRMRRARINK